MQDETSQSNTQVKSDGQGNIFLHLCSGETIGLSTQSISHLMGIDEKKAKYVMREAIEIAIATNIQSTGEMSTILVSIMNRMENPNEQDEPDYLKESSLTIEDIALSFEISEALAKEVLYNYAKPLREEADLDIFFDFIDKYVQENYKGDLQYASERAYLKSLQETNLDLQSILAQKAPEELMSKDEKLKIRYFKEARATVSEVLEVSHEQAEKILNNVLVLKEFLDLNSLEEGEYILTSALEGNQEPLMKCLNARIERIFADISDVTIKSALDPQNLSGSNKVNISNEKSLRRKTGQANRKNLAGKTATSPMDPLVGEIDSAEKKAPSDRKTPVDVSKKRLEEQPKHIPLPNNIEDTLRLCFNAKKRVTSKSLAKIFSLFEIKISSHLAKFIIEDGGFGGEGVDKKRIVDSKKLEMLIKKIREKKTIKNFISFYLRRVNEQVNGLFYNK